LKKLCVQNINSICININLNCWDCMETFSFSKYPVVSNLSHFLIKFAGSSTISLSQFSIQNWLEFDTRLYCTIFFANKKNTWHVKKFRFFLWQNFHTRKEKKKWHYFGVTFPNKSCVCSATFLIKSMVLSFDELWVYLLLMCHAILDSKVFPTRFWLGGNRPSYWELLSENPTRNLLLKILILISYHFNKSKESSILNISALNHPINFENKNGIIVSRCN
jgi:glucose-6-phosphate-specific signal transduction histidine kinase